MAPPAGTRGSYSGNITDAHTRSASLTSNQVPWSERENQSWETDTVDVVNAIVSIWLHPLHNRLFCRCRKLALEERGWRADLLFRVVMLG